MERPEIVAEVWRRIDGFLGGVPVPAAVAGHGKRLTPGLGIIRAPSTRYTAARLNPVKIET